MANSRSPRATIGNAILKMLVWEAGLIALTWVVHYYGGWMKHMRFSDVLFVVGVLAGLMASAGMMKRPFDMGGGPTLGSPAMPVQSTESQKREILLAEIVQQRSFAFRLLGLALLSILISIPLMYISP